jgi:hypothetical protein
MDPTMRELQTLHSADSYADFQRQVLTDPSSRLKQVGTDAPWYAFDSRTADRHALPERRVRQWLGLALLVALAALPMMLSAYGAMHSLH